MSEHGTPSTILLQDTNTVNEVVVESLLQDMELASSGNQNDIEARQATKKYLENKLINEPAEYTILELRITAWDFYAGYLKALTAHSKKS